MAAWIPDQISEADKALLLSELCADCLAAVDDAIRPGLGEIAEAEPQLDDEDGEDEAEVGAEEDEERPRRASSPGKLLDRLLYCGKLPRYAFPTDVATFHVFDRDRSTSFRPIMRFAPSQGLPIALSQYAPGKQVWISGKCYTSGAIYSVMSDDRYEAWNSRRIYMQCTDCGYARTFEIGEAARNETRDCPACGGEETFGPGRYWLRPTGFAHPVDAEEVTSPDDMPETSYATRAKLTMGTPGQDAGWINITDRVRVLRSRQHLLVSNSGPKDEGYSYCTKCGRIEATAESTATLIGPHRKPYPDDDDKRMCEGDGTSRHVVLGTDFITDIALISMSVAAPLKLRPGHSPTIIALRTVSEALAMAACQLLEIEPGEVMAEFRPALTPGGMSGLEAEIFLYDTLPGGAGFSTQIAERGFDLIRHALHIMQSCPEGCDASCYRCLRSFKNKFEHGLLDRHVGAELLEYLLTGEQRGFDPDRLRSSTELLYSDLQRQTTGDTNFELDAPLPDTDGIVVAPILVSTGAGDEFAVALSGPLTSDHPADASLGEYRLGGGGIPVIVENELIVRGNLPAATRSILEKVGVI